VKSYLPRCDGITIVSVQVLRNPSFCVSQRTDGIATATSCKIRAPLSGSVSVDKEDSSHDCQSVLIFSVTRFCKSNGPLPPLAAALPITFCAGDPAAFRLNRRLLAGARTILTAAALLNSRDTRPSVIVGDQCRPRFFSSLSNAIHFLALAFGAIARSASIFA